MPPTFRPDPYPRFNFLVTFDGISDDGSSLQGSFAEVSGLKVEIDVIEYRTGSEPLATRKLPGLPRYSNLVFKRGVIGDATLWNWIAAGLKGQVSRADGSIVLLDETREEVMRWNFRRAWPCKFEGPTLNATASEVAIETLELCHEGIELDT